MTVINHCRAMVTPCLLFNVIAPKDSSIITVVFNNHRFYCSVSLTVISFLFFYFFSCLEMFYSKEAHSTERRQDFSLKGLSQKDATQSIVL